MYCFLVNDNALMHGTLLKSVTDYFKTLFSKDALLIKSDSKYIYNGSKYLFQRNAVLSNFLFIKESRTKMNHSKLLSSCTAVKTV